MNSKQFLQIGGIVLVVVGLLGFFIIGPTADQSIFGETWWFDGPENYAHLVLGVAALLAAYYATASVQKMLTLIVGLIALFFGIYNFTSTAFAGANLESPADMVLHLAIGAWALYAWYNSRSEA